ncbi:MAG TPA: hemolysin family protein [Caulobacteraceae bacterium]|nr:hemolysin family protein [Caulobacteraceae bacterium]
MSEPPPRQSRGLRAFVRRLRRGAPPAAPAAPDGSVDLVDQAEAFKTLRVEEVMTPRADIVAVEIACPFAELLARFLEAEHTRMPIYRETLDDPIGQVHVKDVFKMMVDESIRPAPDEPVLRRLRREVLYAPGSMRAADLLLKMQTSRIHMALIIDEFGGTDGLVTLEDLIEAVVGEIDDEHDEAVRAAVVVRPGGLIEADGRAPLEDLEAAMERTLTPPDLDEDIDTVAGLVSALAGRVPQRGEVIAHPDGFDFEVTDADPRRVKRLRVRPHEPPAAPEDAPADGG